MLRRCCEIQPRELLAFMCVEWYDVATCVAPWNLTKNNLGCRDTCICKHLCTYHNSSHFSSLTRHLISKNHESFFDRLHTCKLYLSTEIYGYSQWDRPPTDPQQLAQWKVWFLLWQRSSSERWRDGVFHGGKERQQMILLMVQKSG